MIHGKHQLRLRQPCSYRTAAIAVRVCATKRVQGWRHLVRWVGKRLAGDGLGADNCNTDTTLSMDVHRGGVHSKASKAPRSLTWRGRVAGWRQSSTACVAHHRFAEHLELAQRRLLGGALARALLKRPCDFCRRHAAYATMCTRETSANIV